MTNNDPSTAVQVDATLTALAGDLPPTHGRPLGLFVVAEPDGPLDSDADDALVVQHDCLTDPQCCKTCEMHDGCRCGDEWGDGR